MKGTKHLEQIRASIAEYVDTLEKTIEAMESNREQRSEIRWLISLKMKLEDHLKYEFANRQTGSVEDSSHWYYSTLCDKYQEKYNIKI